MHKNVYPLVCLRFCRNVAGFSGDSWGGNHNDNQTTPYYFLFLCFVCLPNIICLSLSMHAKTTLVFTVIQSQLIHQLKQLSQESKFILGLSVCFFLNPVIVEKEWERSSYVIKGAEQKWTVLFYTTLWWWIWLYLCVLGYCNWLPFRRIILVFSDFFHVRVVKLLAICPQSATECVADCFLVPSHQFCSFWWVSHPYSQTNHSLYLLGCFLAGVWFVGLESWQTAFDHADPTLWRGGNGKRKNC